MSEVTIRKDRLAGRITLNRPQSLNALNSHMVNAISAALRDWHDDPHVKLVIVDAEGSKAFCAGGDIGALYAAGRQGDHETAKAFFRDEYRMNARVAEFPKPVVAFMHGFVMGGGVGVGGHATHRIVCGSTQISMPEVRIGLVPDVGGSFLLGRAPGRIGEYLGLTGARMGAGDAIFAGFADLYLSEEKWPLLKDRLSETADPTLIEAEPAPHSPLASIDLGAFAEGSVHDIMRELDSPQGEAVLRVMRRNSPLSMAVTLQLVRAARGDASMRQSLEREFRFSSRATTHTDFLEGVRAQIIEKDRRPVWNADASSARVTELLSPLEMEEINIEDNQ
ncbi:Enoyl-CoA hydratase/isomerase (plasmid) [Rhizobium leguminosarum bv. trifolii WSM2304]|uniref:3-hydroxyisobutyryl-CoA hydrolase n=1 Tax=Rhizobium leguminosarum bv. trifolii (strain WSM2304) TaxID=395492 RepID=A0ABF7QZ86_RHILW|nr:enoyl-CoA hydratase/isomerase family protein [Rhizobium leguminosarum]ACI59472.1 Enoyl-CoA hydratase/isomerase [Rhizobium leguminosarum bv. trifolii WSM2304]